MNPRCSRGWGEFRLPPDWRDRHSNTIMRHWEFLIQQEGDLAWLPLESRTTEILEGRYRVVARSDRPNTPVEIAIAHRTFEPEASPPRTQKRSKQTDADGVAVILPYTEFGPGVWTLGCSGLGSGDDSDWQYAVQLRVLPQGAKASSEPGPTPPAPELPLSYQLKLARDDYSLNPSETELTLTGEIRATIAEPLEKLHLRIRLRDPETGQSIAIVQRILPVAPSPLAFSYTLSLPPKRRTRLILGEIVLCDMKPTVLASRSFSVMATVEELLDAVDENAQRAVVEAPEVNPIEASSAFALPSRGVNPEIAPWRAKSTKAADLKGLPPLLQTPDSGRGASKGIELPFASDRPTIDVTPQNGGAIAPQKPLPAADRSTDPQTVETQTEQNPSPGGNFSGSGLYPNDRLTARLSDMAKDGDLSEWFSGETIVGADNPFALESEKESPSSTVSWDTDEIVLDDDLPPTPTSAALVKPEVPAHFQLPADELVPAPELLVPKGKLTSGRSIAIRVKLPDLQPRIYVKLWIHDRQNQTLLEGPLWLTDFLPAEPGKVEIITQLTIPHGGLEIQVEAIAVEMQTQRESRKVSIEREVVPAAPPSLPLEEKEKQEVSVQGNPGG